MFGEYDFSKEAQRLLDEGSLESILESQALDPVAVVAFLIQEGIIILDDEQE